MYRFKLEPLLMHRRNQEESAQKELAQARRKLADEREKLNQAKKEKQQCIHNLQAEKRECNNFYTIKLYESYIGRLSGDIEEQGMCVQRAAHAVDQTRRKLISAMQKHKTLQKLKQKSRQNFERELLQNERKLMDELASIRHARKM